MPQLCFNEAKRLSQGEPELILLGFLWHRIRRRPTLHLLWLSGLAVVLGALAFSLTQHVSLFTGIYWAVTTAATVGYGDVTPHNTVGRLIAIGVMLTAIPLMAAVFVNWSASLASNHVRRFLGMEEAKLRHHLVVYGYNDTVAHMLEQLSQRDEVLLVANIDPGSVPEHVRLMAKDPTQSDVVERSQPGRAERALIAGNSDSAVLMTAVLVNHFAPNLPKTALVQSTKVAQALRDLGVNHCIATDDLVGHTLAKSLETPHAADLLLGIIGNDRWELKEETVPQEWVGQSLAAVRRQFSGVLLGLVQNQTVVLGVEHDPVIEANDQVFVLRVTSGTIRHLQSEGSHQAP